ncbi:hypothetical protein [Cellulomonas marina]|uniref:Uncharacterized protein n=1 Tax=Cellulomonas marina TaxID=988821 RepID=A0A1I0XFF6_9CELL|nr:hypothetical protein [Cellulomonas marina]GIG29855.1 hypothetical protein Cma02nite_24550 [Cellulomonas marina]SFA99809.1 hypothetical protein SAMN05421867_10524 [Cellulomonas marina]
MFEGSKFNWENYHRYEYREVLVEVRDAPTPAQVAAGEPGTAHRFRVDSYDPGEAIVSRKDTQLAEVKPSTARSYIDEVVRKYNPSNSGLRVLGTDSNAAQFGDRSPQIVGRPLRGQMTLEIPVQPGGVPQAVLDYADRWNVRIQDVTGRVYESEY